MYTVTIWLKHHMKHTPYYEVSIPPDAAALICENLDCLCPNEVDKKVLMAYCHDPSHGGSYMAEGAFYIRIGLPPRVVSGDCLASLMD